MTTNADRQRQLGTIVGVRAGKHPDHSYHTVWITLDLKGGTQGFGGMVMEEDLLASYVQEVCRTFGVETFNDLVGKQCYVLRCWGHYDDAIEGLEAVKPALRFTHTQFRRDHGLNAPSPLDKRRENLRREREMHIRSIKELNDTLAKLEDGYIDWSELP